METSVDYYEIIMRDGYFPVKKEGKQPNSNPGIDGATIRMPDVQNLTKELKDAISGDSHKSGDKASPEEVQAPVGSAEKAQEPAPERLKPAPQEPAPEEPAPERLESAPQESAPERFKQGVDIPNLPTAPQRKIDLGHDSAGNQINAEAAGIRK